MCHLERLYFPCCDRPQDTREAVFRYCPNSYLVDKQDDYRGRRKPCKNFKRPKYGGNVVTADFCCGEKCCARMLRLRTIEVNVLTKRAKSAASWTRGLLAPVDCLSGGRQCNAILLARRKQIADYKLKQGCEDCSRLRAEWCDSTMKGLGGEVVEEQEVTEREESGVQVRRPNGLVRVGEGRRPHAYWECECESCELAKRREIDIMVSTDADLDLV